MAPATAPPARTSDTAVIGLAADGAEPHPQHERQRLAGRAEQLDDGEGRRVPRERGEGHEDRRRALDRGDVRDAQGAAADHAPREGGRAVDQFIEAVLPHTEPGDILIDGGNSLFSDTIRRTAHVEAQGRLFIGTGVSGGEEGARTGPSIMPGGRCRCSRRLHRQPLYRHVSRSPPPPPPAARRRGRTSSRSSRRSPRRRARRRAVLPVGRRRRRRPLRQDGAQRDRVRLGTRLGHRSGIARPHLQLSPPLRPRLRYGDMQLICERTRYSGAAAQISAQCARNSLTASPPPTAPADESALGTSCDEMASVFSEWNKGAPPPPEPAAATAARARRRRRRRRRRYRRRRPPPPPPPPPPSLTPRCPFTAGELDSYLIEITAAILAHKDTDGTPLVEKISDTAGQKGRGSGRGLRPSSTAWDRGRRLQTATAPSTSWLATPRRRLPHPLRRGRSRALPLRAQGPARRRRQGPHRAERRRDRGGGRRAEGGQGELHRVDPPGAARLEDRQLRAGDGLAPTCHHRHGHRHHYHCHRHHHYHHPPPSPPHRHLRLPPQGFMLLAEWAKSQGVTLNLARLPSCGAAGARGPPCPRAPLRSPL